MKRAKFRWSVKTQFFRNVPPEFEASTTTQLMKKVQSFADDYPYDGPDIGDLIFNIEHDRRRRPSVARVYFRDSRGDKRRFMRLERRFDA